MTEFLIYDLKVAVLLVVFYLFWQLLASHETFHRLNRMVLLSTIVLSLTLPLCVVTFHKTVEVAELPSKNSTSILSNEAGNPDLQQTMLGGLYEREGVDWRGLLEGPSGSVLFLLYLSGAVFCFARTLYSVYSVRRLISKCELHDAPQLTQLAGGKVVVAVAEKDISPFSWMRTIIMNKTDFEESNAALLAHECGHIRNHHSVDVLFVDVLTALQWFNPVVWFLRQDLRTIHEYEADAAVVSQGFNRYQYLQLLIRKAAGCGGYSIANGINDSTLKKRITMMLKNKTPKHGWMRLLYIVPVVALSLVATAKTVVDCRQPSLATEGVTNDSIFVTIDGGRYFTSMDEVSKMVKTEDIDNVCVIKGKAAVDIFGEELAKNGVIVVETKAHKRKMEQTPPDTAMFNGERDALARTYAIHLKDPKQIDDVLKGKVASAPELDYDGGFNAFLANNLRYPDQARDYGITGNLMIAFRVNADGTTTNPHSVTNNMKGEAEYTGAVVYGYKDANIQKPNAEQQKNAEDALLNEVQRVLKKAPKWKPACNAEGEPMSVTISFPVIFQLK